MAKSLKDVLKGVKSSTVKSGETGTNPGVDYDPKAPDERDFEKVHDVEVHADRVGNTEVPYKGVKKPALEDPKNKKHGPTADENQKKYEKVNEEKRKYNNTSEINAKMYDKDGKRVDWYAAGHKKFLHDVVARHRKSEPGEIRNVKYSTHEKDDK